MRDGRPSRTSEWVAALRAIYTEAPPALAVIDDPLAAQLLPDGVGRVVRWAGRAPFGPRLLHRALGALSLGLSFDVPLRSAAIDEVVRRAVGHGIRQLVLLGAGLDARAWRMPELEAVTVFELDHPSTGAFKRERVGGLAPLAERVSFVAIDFERDPIDRALVGAGFDPAEASAWIWEGVAMYLSRPAVEATLRAIAALSAPASVLAMTYIAPDYASPPFKAIARRLSHVVGEPVHAEIGSDELEALLDRLGMDVESDDTARDWARRYWPAAEARRVRVWEHLVVAIRRSRSR